MAISTIISAIKQVHPKDIVLVKIGSFYHIYGKDAYILLKLSRKSRHKKDVSKTLIQFYTELGFYILY